MAIYCGHEIQLYDQPDDEREGQKTGSIYNFDRTRSRDIGKPREGWNDYEIEVIGQNYRDLPQRRADQRVRRTHRDRRRPAPTTRRRASGSSPPGTSACRTTAAPTCCSTATSGSRTSRRTRPPGSRRARSGCPGSARTRSRSARSTRPGTSRRSRWSTSRSAPRRRTDRRGVRPAGVGRDARDVPARGSAAPDHREALRERAGCPCRSAARAR